MSSCTSGSSHSQLGARLLPTCVRGEGHEWSLGCSQFLQLIQSTSAKVVHILAHDDPLGALDAGEDDQGLKLPLGIGPSQAEGRCPVRDFRCAGKHLHHVDLGLVVHAAREVAVDVLLHGKNLGCLLKISSHPSAFSQSNLALEEVEACRCWLQRHLAVVLKRKWWCVVLQVAPPGRIQDEGSGNGDEREVGVKTSPGIGRTCRAGCQISGSTCGRTDCWGRSARRRWSRLNLSSRGCCRWSRLRVRSRRCGTAGGCRRSGAP